MSDDDIKTPLGNSLVKAPTLSLQKPASNLIQRALLDIERFRSADYYYDLGCSYFDEKSYEKAAEAYKKTTKIDPKFSMAYYFLGVSYNMLGMYPEAIEAAEEVIKLTPDNIIAYISLSHSYSKLRVFKKYGELCNEMKRIINESSPSDENFSKEMIKAILGKNKCNSAEEYFRLGYSFLIQDFLDIAADAFKKAIKINPDFFKAYFELGWIYLTFNIGIIPDYTERIRAALEAFRQATRIEPNDAYAQYYLGKCYYYLKMYNEAIDTLENAIRLKHHYSDTEWVDRFYYYLGASYRDLGKFIEAIEAYKRVIEIKPHFETYLSIGDTYTKLTNYEKAIEAFKKSFEPKSDSADAYLQLGYCYIKLCEYKESIEATNQAIELDPNIADAYLQLGHAYEMLGKYKESREASNQAIQLNPNSAEAHLNLGTSYRHLGMLGDAVTAYKQSIKIMPDYPYPYYWLGVCYYEINRLEEAIESFNEFVKLDPSWVNAYHYLGYCYVLLYKREEAIDAYKQAIRIDPNYSDAHYNLGLLYLEAPIDRALALDEFNILKNLNAELANELYDKIVKISDEEIDDVLEYQKKLKDQNPEIDELLYVGKDSEFSNVFIDTPKLIQKGKNFWVTVRFIPEKVSQFYQNIIYFLKERGCDNKNFGYVEEQWEFEPSKNNYSMVKKAYFDSDGKQIYKSSVEDPKWVSLNFASRRGIIEKVYEIAMTQLMKKDEPNIRQEQIEDSFNEPIHNAKFKKIITIDKMAENLHYFAHLQFKNFLDEFHGLIESETISDLKIVKLDNEFYLFIQVATLIIGLAAFDKSKVQKLGDKYILQFKKVAAVSGMTEEKINNLIYGREILRITAYQKAWNSFDSFGKRDPFLNLTNLFWKIIFNIMESDKPNVTQDTIEDFLNDKIALITIPDIHTSVL